MALYQSQKARFEKMGVDMRRMHGIMVRDTFDDAQRYTSGGVRTSELRRLGHPFGRGRAAGTAGRGGLKRGSKGKTKIASLPINYQSGRLRRSWSLKLTKGSGGAQTYILGNNAPYAKYILNPSGTRKMVGRGLWGHSAFTKMESGTMGLLARRARARNKAIIDEMRRRNRRP